MDGNGRWAQKRGLSRTDGHKAGAKVVREITEFCAKKNIKFLSLYAFSTENWARPKTEVEFLMKLLGRYLKNEEKTYVKNSIRFKAIGDLSAFSKQLQHLIFNLEQNTAKNKNLTQILALNYGSKDEIARAILKMQPTLLNKNLDKSKIGALFEASLDTSEIPPVDLLIRTGGEMRLSNFLLYQCAYAELFFSPILFPDFNASELEAIINNFNARTRRFGGI